MERRICYGCMREIEAEVCPHCGWTAQQNNERHQLPVGTVLADKYIIGRALGQGGFGITYLGLEYNLNMVVCIKEFYPSSTVNRDSVQSMIVNCNTQTMEASYASHRERFLREAKSLARFRDVPQIVSIYEFFQMNNTAYMVMEFVDGVDMAKYIRSHGGRLPMDHVLTLLRPVMEALTRVHDEGLIHRDISPDNIMIQSSGAAKLLDFGAARNVDNPDMEQMLTHSTEAIIKNGFAPMEQYATRGSLGPWTDVYAMSATIYYSLTGKVLENAPTRMLEGGALDWSNAQGLTEHQKAVLEQGLALNIKERIPTVRQLMEGLFAGAPAVPVIPKITEESDGSGNGQEDLVSVTISKRKEDGRRKKSPAAIVIGALAAAAVLAVVFFASRPSVAGVQPSDSDLHNQLLPGYAAVGCYEVSCALPLSGERNVSFPVGMEYEGMEIILTDAQGQTCARAPVVDGSARAKVAAQGCYLAQVITAETEQLNWTDWAETLPEGVLMNSGTVEAAVQYRTRDKEYLEYNRPTLEGWTLEGQKPSTTPYGQWNEWQEQELTGSEYTEVEQQRLYRFRTNEQTTSTSAVMEGWTQTGSKPEYTTSAWSDWSETAASPSDTREVEQKQQWRATWNNVFMSQVTTSDTGWVDGTNAPSVGDMQMSGTASYKECTSVSRRTLYRTRTKTYQYTTYYFSRWTEWSDWSTEETAAQANVEVESKTVYRSREIFGDTAYSFWRWQDWTEWSLEAPQQQEGSEYEERIVYRYVPQP